MTTSPTKAKESGNAAHAGPEDQVGMEMKGKPASESLVSEAVVFAICIEAKKYHRMRAPPEAVMQMKGILCSTAVYTATHRSARRARGPSNRP